MAYRKLTRVVNLPMAVDQSIGETDEKEKLNRLQRLSTGIVSALKPYLDDVVQALNEVIGGYIASVILQKQTTAPSNPVSGMVAYADGVGWNPGAGGEGIYAYYSGTWNKL